MYLENLTIPEWLQSYLVKYGDGQNVTEGAALICRAFNFAYTLHKGQLRRSGEPYIVHPLAVADLLYDLSGESENSAMIAAGLLHDLVEDTDVTLEQIEKEFNSEVCQIVSGLTRLTNFDNYNLTSTQEQQAENFRRMFMAMAKDIRVIIVKLADRLHNMRTLEYLDSERQQRIAQETLEIFAPLANRLGIGRFKWELEDLSFKYLKPQEYKKLTEKITERRLEREEHIKQLIDYIGHQLCDINIYKIQGRPKHLYSIYKKMKRFSQDFEDIKDILAIRIITEAEHEKDAKRNCYQILEVIHDLFKPIPGYFKDYIGLPKSNNYQSLHTTVIEPSGQALEIQIRTLAMHRQAEYGIAAHWKYKETESSSASISSGDEKFIWLREILEWQNDLKDAQEYVDNVKGSLFEDDVYVFTPTGDVIALKQGSTPVDFAYHIHTEVGNHIKGAVINEVWSDLGTKLKNGDIVKIVTDKNSHPNSDWLNFTVTSKARTRIRSWLKRLHRDENIVLGRELLEDKIGKNGLDALLKSKLMQEIANFFNYHSVDDMIAALGYGDITSDSIVNRLAGNAQHPQSPKFDPDLGKDNTSQYQSLICSTSQTSTLDKLLGLEGIVHHIAKCCSPLPGDSIIGVITRQNGISVHQQHCSNLANAEGERLIPLSWNRNDISYTVPINLRICAINRIGLLQEILAKISSNNINVCKAVVLTDKQKPASISLTIEVNERDQLNRCLVNIRKISDVLSVKTETETE